MGFSYVRLQTSSATFLSLLLSLFLLPLSVSGQARIDFLSQDAGGAVNMAIKNLPELTPVVRSEEAEKAKIPTPHYEYLWVFSDGEFINQSKDAALSHTFIGPDGSSGNGIVLAFTTGVYSDDHLDFPPSARVINDTTPAPINFFPVARQEVFTDGMIKLSSNQRGFVARDRTVFIISLRNPFDFRIGTYLLFLSDPAIEAKTEGETKGDVRYDVFLDDAGDPVPAAFSKSLDLDPQNRFFSLDEVDAALLSEGMRERYNKVYRYASFTLESQEVRNVFVEFEVDTALFDKGPEEGLGALRFTALLMVDQAPGPNTFLDAQDSTLIQSLGVQQLLDTLGNLDQPAGNQVIDLSTFGGDITRSHDPNYVKTEICECPPGSDGAFKLFSTVHFSNEGNQNTNNISVSVPFPPEYDIFSIPDTLLSIYPRPPAPILPIRDAATNTVTWELAGFQLFPEAEYGLGHPLTYGEFQFTVLVNPTNGNVDSIPYLQACIVFDGQDEICTVPVKPVQVESDAAARVLECQDCVSAAGPGPTPFPIPWWLLILLLLLLILLLIWAAIRRRISGNRQQGSREREG